jgi:hypothetical protein
MKYTRTTTASSISAYVRGQASMQLWALYTILALQDTYRPACKARNAGHMSQPTWTHVMMRDTHTHIHTYVDTCYDALENAHT